MATKTLPRIERTGPRTRPPGRPRKWPRLIALRQRGIRKKIGPYKNPDSAVAAASWFNREMSKIPFYADVPWVFRGRGLFVVLRKPRESE